MAFDALLERDRRVKRLGSGFDVAVTAIDRGELGSEAEDGDIDGLAALTAKMIFRSFDDHEPQSGSLMCGVDGKLTQVAARATGFSVDTAQELA